jgi:hypothetical protein
MTSALRAERQNTTKHDDTPLPERVRTIWSRYQPSQGQNAGSRWGHHYALVLSQTPAAVEASPQQRADTMYAAWAALPGVGVRTP